MVANHVEALTVGGRTFELPLCKTTASMGSVPVQHWWMDTRQLYGQRNRAAAIGTVVVDFFWALCRHHRTDGDPAVQESFILAPLLPYARSNAARAIFNDSRPGRPRDGRTDNAHLADLEGLLNGSRGKSLSLVQFNRGIADVLGPPALAPGEEDFYRDFTAGFLGPACDALSGGGDAGLAVALGGWRKAVSSWGRRAGFETQKRVLNVLSYECRTALHRCYSATWFELLPRLVERRGLDRSSLDFLRLWHLDHVWDAAEDVPAKFHLFHGHIFGLHPVGSDLIRTATGRELIGRWLVAPDRSAAFDELLHAIYLTALGYSLRRGEVSEERRVRPLAVGSLDSLADREAVAARRRGRRTVRSIDAPS